MRSNFDFLDVWPKLQKEAKEAEVYARDIPRYSLLQSSLTLEIAVQEVYRRSLSTIYPSTLQESLYNKAFKDKLPPKIWLKLDYIRITRNKGVHKSQEVEIDEALEVLVYLFEFLGWFHTYYSPNLVNTPRFDEKLIPKGNQVEHLKKELNKLSDELAQMNDLHEK